MILNDFDLYGGKMKLNEFIRQHNNCYIEDISKAVNGKNIFWAIILLIG